MTMLKEAYGKWPVVIPSALEARHARHSIHTKASRLGLTRGATLGKQYAHVTPEEWAYMAGIVDGEGTIHIFDPVEGRRNGNRVVSVANTDAELIRWLKVTFPGCGTYVQHHTVRADGRFGHNKPVTHVRWTRTAFIQELLEGMLPYLIIKKEKAMSMLDRFSALT